MLVDFLMTESAINFYLLALYLSQMIFIKLKAQKEKKDSWRNDAKRLLLGTNVLP